MLLLLTLSLAIRLWGIHDRLPDASLKINVLDDSVVEETDRTTMGRAWMLWSGGTKPLDLNPHTGGWPALSFYLTLGIQLLSKVYYTIVSGGATSAQFQNYMAGPGASPMFLFARIVGALIGVLTVYLAYRVAAMTIGRAGGLIAGLLLATNTLHVLTSQHVSDPNLLALLFVLLAAPPLLRVLEGGTLRDSILAGAMIGLAGACKYVPLILGLPLALAHLRRPDLTSFFKNRGLWAGLLAIPVAFFVASPFLLIDWKRTLIDITGQRRSLFSDWVGQTAFPISLPTYLTVSLPHAMGWPAYLLGLAGLYFLWKESKVTRMLVWIPVMIVLVNGMLKTAQERYILIALPFLHIAAAFAILKVVAWAMTRVHAFRGNVAMGRAAPVLLAAAAVAWPLPELLATRHALSLPDSRHLSKRWIDQNLGPDRTMAVELYGPVFNMKDRAFVVWPFFATQSELARPAYHAGFLDGFEYHVASGEISRRFEAEPGKYPVENAYFRWLRDRATVVWESDAKKNSGPHIVIRRLPPDISTRAQRDSVFRTAMPTPTKVNRVGLWCLDCAKQFIRVQNYPRAEEWARRGLEVGVGDMEASLQHQLATALWRRDQVDSAEAHMRIAVEKLPQSSTFRIYHASMLGDLGRHKEALEQLYTAYELSNHDPRIHINLAQQLSALGRHQEAVDELLQTPPGNSQRGLALRDAAVILLNDLDRPAEALGYLRESIELDPNQEQSDLVRQQIARLEAVLGKR